jgi:hypothetical protein
LSSACGCLSRRAAALVVIENIPLQGSNLSGRAPWPRLGSGSVRLRTYSFAHPAMKEVAPMPGKRDAYELLLIEEADAWFEYLEATRAQSALRYKEIEPWAWARLSQRLRAIRTKKAKLKPAAA